MLVRTVSLVGLVFLTCSPLSAAIERLVERTLPTAGHPKVRVDTFYGSIQVKPGEGPDVNVVVRETLDAKSEEAADKQLKELDLKIESDSQGVIVRAQTKRMVRWSWEKWPPVGLAFEITVPASCDLDLVTRDGGVTVGNLQGTVSIKALQGAVFVGNVQGPVTVLSASGDVAVTAASEQLEIVAESGNVVVGRALGATKITASSGAVEIQAARGSLDVKSEGRDMRVGFLYPLNGDATLHLETGDAVLSFDPSAAIAVIAEAGASGKVSARDLAFNVRAGAWGTRTVQADLNGGGRKVTIKASRGSVRLLAVPAMPASP